MAKALFVIDMQEVTVGKNHSAMFNYPDDIVQKVNSVIGENEGNVIVYIRNLMKNNLINKIAPVKCFDGSKEAELAEGLSVRSKNVFDKYKGDAFSNPDLLCSPAEFMTIDEGLCVQIMHHGPYDDEPATVALMDEFLAENGYVNDFNETRLHHEIYMSDARKVAPEKLKTVIRHPIRRA